MVQKVKFSDEAGMSRLEAAKQLRELADQVERHFIEGFEVSWGGNGQVMNLGIQIPDPPRFVRIQLTAPQSISR